VLLVVARGGRTLRFTIVCGARRLTLDKLRIRRGAFSGIRSEAGARRNPVARVEGRFVSARRATGTFTSSRCRPQRIRWSATRR
jgi:hypothetical protein